MLVEPVVQSPLAVLPIGSGQTPVPNDTPTDGFERIVPLGIPLTVCIVITISLAAPPQPPKLAAEMKNVAPGFITLDAPAVPQGVPLMVGLAQVIVIGQLS